MATTGKLPIRGFKAGAIKWVVTRGYAIGVQATVYIRSGQRVMQIQAEDRVMVIEK